MGSFQPAPTRPRMRTVDLLDRLLLATAAFVAGVGVGVLVAPAAGERTRRRLAQSTTDAAAAVGERSREWTAPLAERARDSARELSSRHLPLSDDWDLVDPETLRDVAREAGQPRGASPPPQG